MPAADDDPPPAVAVVAWGLVDVEAAPALALELRLMTTVTVWGAFGATVVQVNEGGGALHVNLRAGTV